MSQEQQQIFPYLQRLLNGAPVEWKPLGEVATMYGGLTGKNRDDFNTGDALYIPYKNVFSNIEVDPTYLEPVTIGENEKQNEVRYGDVIFTGSSETPDEAGMSSAVTNHFDTKTYLNSFCFGVRFNEDIQLKPEFSKYLFRSTHLRKQIIKTANGVTRFNVSKNLFRKIIIPIPPMEVQERIVEILDKFTELQAELQAELALREKQYIYFRDQLLSFEMLNRGGIR